MVSYDTNNHSSHSSLSTNLTNTTGDNTTGDPFDNLYPALIQCFGIIIFGYITGRLGIIYSTEAKGLSKFALNACLPAFIFRAIVMVDFGQVTWKFVFVVGFAKLIIFAAVVVLTLLFTRDIGKAGAYGMFCTVSNDLAMGIPLLEAMYQETHREFIYCLYFLVLVALVFFVPLGLVMMEFSKQRSEHTSVSFGKNVLQTLKAVIINPAVIGSVFGIPFNFVFKQDIPSSLDMFLRTLSNAFPATALFYLGLTVVGKIKGQFGMIILVPLSLVATKVIILPLLIRALTTSFDIGGSIMNEDWSTFGFIYGTIPAAPTSVMYAAAFGIQDDLLASGMVVSTFVSAPVMFTSSKMSSVREMNCTAVEYRNLLSDTRNDASFVAISMAIWTILVLFIGRRHKIPPHNYTTWLAFSQLCLCVSFVLTMSDSFIDNCKRLECFLIATFLFATHCWTGVLAFELSNIRCSANQSSLRRKLAMYFCGWGVPVFCSAITLIVLESEWRKFSNEYLDFFHFLEERTAFSAVWVTVQVVCVISCISSLIRLHRGDTYCKCAMIKQTQKADEKTPLLFDETSEQCHRCKAGKECSSTSDQQSGTSSSRPASDIEDIDVTHLLAKSKNRRSKGPKQTTKDKLKLDKYYEGEKHQCGRHVLLIVCQILVMLICIFYCMWILVNDDQKSGIFLEVQLLVSIVLSGQVLIIFAIFGLERTMFIDPLLQKLRLCWYGIDEVILPNLDDLPVDEYHVCEQFVFHHKANCARDLATDIKSSVPGDLSCNSTSASFLGSELVDWLLEVGLVSDRITAVHYGNSLLRGRVISHIDKRHYFTDTDRVYEFCTGWEDIKEGQPL